jgi:hypothetical protein
VISVSSTPPESGPAFPASTGIPAEQYGGQQGMFGPRRRRMATSRIVCGILWAALTVILAIGFVLELTIDLVGGAVVCLGFAVGCGWYDYRIWTYKAKRLWFPV